MRCLTINISDDLKILEINPKQCHFNGMDFSSLPITQEIGIVWIKNLKILILKVTSSITIQESNFLIDPLCPDFNEITIKANELFLFDNRTKV